MSNMIRVNESFVSIQGEGFWTGTPCYFIRLQGCDVRCSFCDSKDTWNLSGGTLMTFQEIIDQIRKDGKIKQFETVHKRKDGSLYPVEIHLQFSKLELNPVFVAFIIDMSGFHG